ncbi:MAG: class I SAM-dependent methyltransferase [Prosthecobacter sp.]
MLTSSLSPRLLPDSEFFHSRRDQEFDQVFPEAISRLSVRHWSPVHVCRAAARLLVVDASTRVLDIGCGPGKFCIIGATTTKGHFTGVERRSRLARLAQEVVREQNVPRVDIVRGDIQEVDFGTFDAFYLFNPFQENIMPSLRIDDDAELGPHLYTDYTMHVRQQLTRMPAATRVVTYCGACAEIPAGYVCVKTAFNDTLKLWIKTATPNQPCHASHRHRD